MGRLQSRCIPMRLVLPAVCPHGRPAPSQSGQSPYFYLSRLPLPRPTTIMATLNQSVFPSGYRAYSQPFGTSNGTISFNQLYDANLVYNVNAATPGTGGWRPFFPSDFASNVSVSGLSVSVGAVAVTGIATVAVTSFPVTGPAAAISGSVVITNSAPIAVSGALSIAPSTGVSTVNLNQAGFTPTFGFITSGQVSIPTGTRAYSIWIESGNASIAGIVYNLGTSIAGGGYPNYTLSTAFGVGCSGTTGSPCRINYNYEV